MLYRLSQFFRGEFTLQMFPKSLEDLLFDRRSYWRSDWAVVSGKMGRVSTGQLMAMLFVFGVCRTCSAILWQSFFLMFLSFIVLGFL